MLRVAIYWTPEDDSPLARAAVGWLGRDGRNLRHPDRMWPVSMTESRFRELIAAPFHYGFHGTIKPPFRLLEGVSVDDIVDSLETFSANRSAFILPPMKVARINNFFCLRPVASCQRLSRLAAETVKLFNCFRKPPGEAELQKRRKAGLNERQENLLLRWGYPYVMEEFRFHLTLTGNVEDPRERELLHEELSRRFAPVVQKVFFSSLCLFIERDGRPLRLMKRFPLRKDHQNLTEIENSCLILNAANRVENSS